MSRPGQHMEVQMGHALPRLLLPKAVLTAFGFPGFINARAK